MECGNTSDAQWDARPLVMLGDGDGWTWDLGWRCSKTGRISGGTKLLSLGLGLLFTLVLLVLEVPLEGILAVLVPFLGLAFDAVVDGMELIALPLLFGAILLTHLAPKSAVEAIRAERMGLVGR